MHSCHSLALIAVLSGDFSYGIRNVDLSMVVLYSLSPNPKMVLV